MCTLALALTGLATGLQAYGTYQQGQAQAAAYEAQAQAAQAQADAAYQNAKIQNKQGEQMAEQYAWQQRKLDNQRRLVAGQNAVQAGASGIVGGIGSGLDIYNASMAAWNEDSINLLNNQRNDLYGSQVKEVNLRNEGNSYVAQSNNLRAQASAAKENAVFGAITTLAGGAASMIGMKGSGGSGNANSATAQTPTAAGWEASGLDRAMQGINGYTPVTTRTYQGYTQSFGPKVLKKNPYGVWNGSF